MTPKRRVGRGPVGGASDDAGVEYRRAVAAYAATCGLAGVHLPGVAVPEPDAYVEVVSLETESAVDDIEVQFTSGWTASIQAKRTLKRGTPLTNAVKQWVVAGKAGVDPSRQRLVIASGSLNGPMQHLRTVLDRRRLSPAGPATAAQKEILDHVIDLLGDLTTKQRNAVLDAAVIWELAVEEPDQPGAREALSHLGSSGYSIPPRRATAVWAELRAAAGRLARNRAGATLQGWLLELRKGGMVVERPGENPAGDLERQRQVMERYYERLVRESREIDLRALGAKLPPLPIEGADSGVKVGTDPEDTRDKTDLIWAFLRLGRVVITALPGGGKSTAVKRVAGNLATKMQRSLDAGADTTHYPFPVRASLRDINALSDVVSFRDRMIAIATRDDSKKDREILSAVIEDRLDNDRPIALLLDALDETHDDRMHVVADLHNFLQSVPAGVCVLVATRDVAYSDAATLGWPDLRLLPPEEPAAPVAPLLAAAAAHLRIKEAERDEWVRQRKEWTSSIMSREPALRETPLTPLLLAILAIERTVDRLPQTRPEVLQDVVTTVVSRRELTRQCGQTLGPLAGSNLDSAATRAFAAEGSTILSHDGIAPVNKAAAAIAETLADHWNLARGHAESAGIDAIRLFDETGLFVIDPAASTVSSRLALFSEIADAINAIGNPETLPDWVTSRVATDKVEPIVLAAALDEDARSAFEAAFEADRDNSSLVRAAIQARKDGAELSNDIVQILREQVIAEIATGTAEGWARWRTLSEIGLPPALGAEAVAAAAVHSPEHAALVQAFLDLEQRSDEDIRSAPGAALEILRVRRLPSSPRKETSASKPSTESEGWKTLLGDRPPLADVQLRAAEVLIGHEPETVDLIASLAEDTTRGHRKRLLQLLEDNGHQKRAEQLRTDGLSAIKNLDWFKDFDETRYPHLLEILSEGPQRALSTEQVVRLGELGDFLETMGLNDSGANSLYKQNDDYLREILDTGATLFGFDRATIASQAQIALRRMCAEGDNGDEGFVSYFSLFNFAHARTKNDWTAVADVSAAVDLILRLFWMTRDQAHLAMKMLWGSRKAKPFAVPLLRPLIEDVKSSPAHQRLVAITLITFNVRPEPASWVQSENPVLRAVAARTIDAIKNGKPTPRFKKLLFDEDGHVRKEAITNISDNLDPIADELLAQVADERPGWMCISCRTVNPNGLSTACTKEGCYASNPRPDEVALRALADRVADAGARS
jgi:hypothetical protein